MSLSGTPVLVTGAGGFIGSHLAERLVHEGAKVRALCSYRSTGSRGWLDIAPHDVTAEIEFRFGDIRDAAFVDNICEGVDVVMHLAALISIPYSYVAPRSFVDTNVIGTLNILEAARRHRVRRVVHASTSEVYGTPTSLPIRETHPIVGQSPYSATKIAADKLCESFYRAFGLPVVTVRPFNTYGPRQSERAVLPTILTQLLSGRPRIRLGDLRPRRDLTFVADTAHAFVLAGSVDGLEGEVVQLGTGRTVSIGELLEIAQEVTGCRAVPELDEQRLRPESSEVQVLESDPTKARERLGWRPRITLEEGVRITAEWCKRSSAEFRSGTYQI